MNALTMSATRRRDKVVILTGPAIGASYSTPIDVRLSRALSTAWQWARKNCTPVQIARVLFSGKVSTAVAFGTMATMWWHIISIPVAAEAQEAMARDILYALPWAAVWAVRFVLADIKSSRQKGGKL